jgi:hypothetical protein
LSERRATKQRKSSNSQYSRAKYLFQARASNTRQESRLLARPLSTLRDIAELMTTKYRKQMMFIIADDYRSPSSRDRQKNEGFAEDEVMPLAASGGRLSADEPTVRHADKEKG